MNAMSEFWNTLALFAADKGVRESDAALATARHELASSELALKKASKAKNAALVTSGIAEVRMWEGIIVTLEDRRRMFAVALEKKHAEMFPITGSKIQTYGKGNKAQVVIQRGGKSYTRHVVMEGGKWRGNAIIGNGVMTYPVQA